MSATAETTAEVVVPGHLRPLGATDKCVGLLLIAVRLSIGFLLVASAGGKLLNPFAFLQTIQSMQILPSVLTVPAAMVIPTLEVVLGVCLIAGLAVPSAFAIASVLLLTFVGALASVVWRGLDVPCGCFGTTSSSSTTWGTVGRTAMLLLMALLGWMLSVRQRVQDR